MIASLWTWIVVAVTVFWCVGLHQRMQGLRAAVLEDLVLVEKQLTRYIHLVEMQSAEEESRPLPPQWTPLVEAVRTLQATSQAARSTPFGALQMQSLGAGIDAIREQVECLRMPQGVHRLWQEAVFSVNAARAGYNDHATEYNEALQQFPARLVVGLMGFKAALRL